MSPYACHGELTEQVPSYAFIVPTPDNSVLLPSWLIYSRQAKENAVVIVDFRHNDLDNYLYEYFPKTGLGVTIGGQAVSRRNTGKAMSYAWWSDKF